MRGACAWLLSMLVAGCGASSGTDRVGSSSQALLDKPVRLDFADQPGEKEGAALATLGDVDGDGNVDLMIGAPGWGTPLGFPGEGRAYVWSSASPPDAPSWTADPADEDKAGFGSVVVAAGDVNGDGYDDAVVASHSNAFAFTGSASGLSADPVWLAQCTYCGVAAGDIDGDGFGDVVLWTNGELRGYRGGAAGLATSPSWTTSATNGSGSIAGVGDVNKDGFDDILVGDATSAGTIYLYLGSAAGLPSSPSWAAPSPGGSSFGYHVAAAGDANGDGYADFLAGDSFHVYLYLGPRDATSSTLADWGPQQADAFGSAGDVDGDGYGDLLLTNSSKVWLFAGSATKPTTPVEVPNPDNPSGTFSMDFGAAVAALGDIDGDGKGDVALGAPGYGTSVAGGLGRVYVLESLAAAGGSPGAGGSGGGGGAAAGAGGSGGGAGSAGAAPYPPGAGSGSSGGCGCHAAGGSRASWPLAMLALAVFAFRRRGEQRC